MRNFVTCFLLFLTFLSLLVSCITTTKISYSDHCNSVVPESSPKYFQSKEDFHHDRTIRGFFTGKTGLLNLTSYFYYQTITIHVTDVPNLYYLDARLIFNGLGYDRVKAYKSGSSRPSIEYFPGDLIFDLSGYWLESTGKLCMVGSGSTLSKQGEKLDLDVVLKLLNFKISTDFSNLIKGTLESLSDSKNGMEYFQTVSLLIFPQTNYPTNSLLSSNNFEFPSGSYNPPVPGLPLSSLEINGGGFCRLLQNGYGYRGFDLKYSKRCLSAKTCSPLGGDFIDLPYSVSLGHLHCFKDEKSSLLLIKFKNTNTNTNTYNSLDLNPNMTWVGEAKWDEKENQIMAFACQLSGLEDESFSKVHLGDCSLRLTLKYPSTFSIKNAKSVKGRIWINGKNTQEHDLIELEGSDFFYYRYSNLKYKYTQIEKVLKSCPEEKKPAGNEIGRYPNAYSATDMRFDFSVRISGKDESWGSANPNFVDDQSFSQFQSWSFRNPSTKKIRHSHFNKFNVSYTMSVPFPQSKEIGGNFSIVAIQAEGVYDSETGSLCMIGCRNIAPNNQIIEDDDDSFDCEILIKFKFPDQENLNKSERYSNGSIESRRKVSDPLFFKSYEFVSTTAFDRIEAEESLERMDMEVILALISIFFSSVFVAFQIFHVKKEPEIHKFISISMLLLLTFGYMIPLVMTFEDLFSKRMNRFELLQSAVRGIDVEVIVRAAMLVAFLLQCRLLQLTLSAKRIKESRKQTIIAEMAALLITAALHICGFILTGLLVKFPENYKYKYYEMNSSSSASSWKIWRRYTGLILDFFLLPQILFNAFGNWKRKSLSPIFYFGTTTVNLVPHAYDLYRYKNYERNRLQSRLIYASPDEDFFSVGWDIFIPVGCLVLALVIFLQQKLGGRFMLPKKFRDSGDYVKIPSVLDEQEPWFQTNL